MQVKKYKCPCCGLYTLVGRPFEICHVCFWECWGIEDDTSRYNPNLTDGANDVPLIQARQNYKNFGASSIRIRPYVSPPEEYECVQTDAEYIEVEVNWPTIQELKERLDGVLNGRITRNQIASWAEYLIDLEIQPDNEGMRELLKPIALLEDDDDEAADNCDIREMLGKIPEFGEPAFTEE